MNRRIIDSQNAIVLHAANGIDVPWDHVLINFEREVIDDESTEDCLFVSFVKDGGGWKRQSHQLDSRGYDLFLELSAAMSDDANSRWSSATLEVNASGQYRFAFSYDPPKRLNGDFGDEALFKHYVPQQFK